MSLFSEHLVKLEKTLQHNTAISMYDAYCIQQMVDRLHEARAQDIRTNSATDWEISQKWDINVELVRSIRNPDPITITPFPTAPVRPEVRYVEETCR